MLVRQLHDKSDVTAVFVTLDHGEAGAGGRFDRADRGGASAGHDPPETFNTRPPSLTAARFFAVINELAGRVRAGVFVDDTGNLRVAARVPNGPAVLAARLRGVTHRSGAHPINAVDVANTFCGRVDAARFADTHVTAEVTPEAGTTTVLVHTGVAVAPHVGELYGALCRPVPDCIHRGAN